MSGRATTTSQHGVRTFNQAMTGRQAGRFSMRGITGLITAIVTALVAITAGPGNLTTAHAWVDGKRYAMGFTFDHNTATYFIDANTVPGWDIANIKNAARGWTAVMSNLFYIPGGTSTSTADVQIIGTTRDPGYSGLGGCNNVGTTCPSRSGAASVTLYFDPNNPTSVNGGHANYSDTPTFDTGIAGQEEGHTFGLDHSCLPNQVMQGPNWA